MHWLASQRDELKASDAAPASRQAHHPAMNHLDFAFILHPHPAFQDGFAGGQGEAGAQERAAKQRCALDPQQVDG